MKNLIFIALAVLGWAGCTQMEEAASSDENAIAEILSRINTPDLPDLELNLMDFGESEAILQNIRPALDSAVRTCAAQGGGKIVVPAGNYFSEGPIHLLSNIQLQFEEGAVVTFSQEPEDYLPVVFVRWEGVECYNYSPYIYAKDQENIIISGKVRFNGNAEGGIQTWLEKQKPFQSALWEMGRNGVPVNERIFGEDHWLRPAFLQLVNCENVLISDIQIENVPFWVVQLTYCKNVTVRGIRVNSRFLNNDGCDPDSSEDVLIEDCHFTTGDDAIAVKSGRDQDGWRVNRPSKNIVIRNCHTDLTLHGVAFGSEMSAGIENVYVQNFTMGKVDQYAVQFKANRDRGGYIRNVFIDGVKIDSAKTAIYFTNDYHSYAGGTSPSAFSDISIKNYSCGYASDRGIDMVGTEENPIHHVQFSNVTVESAARNRMEYAEDIQFNNVNINGQPVATASDLVEKNNDK
ncbi:MAG: glycoside hydrolase family 28 protein [Saprospiraceae bacterium]|nr:glycoside hydrolase family 28 protein [Lewinella sp.]